MLTMFLSFGAKVIDMLLNFNETSVFLNYSNNHISVFLRYCLARHGKHRGATK